MTEPTTPPQPQKDLDPAVKAIAEAAATRIAQLELDRLLGIAANAGAQPGSPGLKMG